MKSEEIKKRRLELGFSQEELANRFEIDVKLLQDWESAISSPPHPKLVELAFDALEGNWAISQQTQAEVTRIQKFINDSHKNMLKIKAFSKP